VSNLAEEAGSFGVDKIYVVEDPRLRDYLTDHYTSAMTQVVETVLPKVLLFGQNDVGEDLAPRLAFRLGVPVSMDCVNLDIDPHTKQLLRTKPVYGGIAMGVYVAEGFPQVATVRAKSLPAAERNTVAEAPIIPINVNLDRKTQLMKFAERVVEYTEGVKLEDAEVVISGGRGRLLWGDHVPPLTMGGYPTHIRWVLQEPLWHQSFILPSPYPGQVNT
jgi:electron transfer flavoprotein alpha subunit